jgi:predicted RNA-binding protein associated with RNAse of E/G family
LLETQEFQDGQVDSWVETETSLVWAEGRVELDSVTTVDLWLKVIILPDNTELDDALWDGDDLEGGLVFGVLLEE